MCECFLSSPITLKQNMSSKRLWLGTYSDLFGESLILSNLIFFVRCVNKKRKKERKKREKYEVFLDVL